MAESRFARLRRESIANRQAARALIKGIPALVVVITTAICLLQTGLTQHEAEAHRRYLEAAQQALDAADWENVDLLSRKLIALKPDDDVGTYLLAQSAAAEGDANRARRLMSQLAPVDAPGFPAAQWWIVRDLVAGHQNLTVAQAGQIRGHLMAYLSARPNHSEARMLLGQAELALGQLEPALQQMRRAADDNPAFGLVVARVAARFGRNALAHLYSRQACRWLEQQVYENPNSIETRLQWADALAMTGALAEAGEALLGGLRLKDDPRLRSRLVQLSVTTFDVIAAKSFRSEADFEQQLALIDRCLPLAPNHQPLLHRLAQLRFDPLDCEARAQNLLQSYFEAGTAPALVHLVCSEQLLRQGDAEAALAHLEQAHRKQPNSAACLNNLAWVLAQESPSDLKRALALIDQAIALAPQRPEYRETRGEILVRMARFEEAIPELRQGLAEPGSFTQTHAVLADAYDAVGKTQLAAYYRQQQ